MKGMTLAQVVGVVEGYLGRRVRITTYDGYFYDGHWLMSLDYWTNLAEDGVECTAVLKADSGHEEHVSVKNVLSITESLLPSGDVLHS